MNEEDSRDLAYLLVAGVAVVGLVQLWNTQIKPWAAEQYEQLAGRSLEEGWVTDAIAVAVLAVPVLILLLVVRSTIRKRRKAKKERQASEAAS